MKKSISHLPAYAQEDLNYLVELILQRIPQTQMIILYGSYARGSYVVYDQRVEFGIPTSFVSDYDILVVTHGVTDREVGQKLNNIQSIYHTGSERQPAVQFINEDIKSLNKSLSEGRYFNTQLKKDGIMLYDSGRFKLARRRKLKYTEIKQQAEEYYKEKVRKARLFYEQALFMSERKEYVMASFNLHQTCETLFHATRLVYTLNSDKQHNLENLLSSVRKYSPGFEQIFPCNTPEEKRLFDLVKAAYVEARYNPQFVVTKEDCDALMLKVDALFALVEQLYIQRIQEYDQMT